MEQAMQDLTTVSTDSVQVKPATSRPKRRYSSEDLFTAHPVDGKLPDRDEACVQFYPFLLRSAKQHLAEGMTHQDVAQLASLLFLRTFPKYLPDERGVWFAAARLCSAARCVARQPLAQLKRQCPNKLLNLDREKVDPDTPEPVERLAVSDQAEAMLAALGEVDEAAAEALRLRYLEERSHEEIAAALGTSRHAVVQRLAAARSKVQKLFDVAYVAPPSQAAKKRAAKEERKRFREERRLKAEELARQGFSAIRIAKLVGASRGLGRRAVYRIRGQVVTGM
jgi:RNA polymerase sigma factor (sigma-70 family)